MKRFLMLLAAVVLLFGCAHAQEISSVPIATYALPKGAEALYLWDSVLWEMPEGLEGMYRLMQNASVYGNVYLVRMPNGRALVSVSCMEPDNQYTPQELLGLWPQIARNIAKEGVWVDAGENCARTEPLYGFEALHIETEMGIAAGDEEQALKLDAEGIAFYRGTELLEVWAVAPSPDTYAADDTAAQELADDLAAMDAFMQSLNFRNLESSAMEGVPYTDQEGRFTLLLPVGCTVLTHTSSAEEIEQARESYLAAHEEGADRLFDDYLSDLISQKEVLILSEDRQTVVGIYAAENEMGRGADVVQLLSMGQLIQQSLAERYEVALPLAAGDTAVISSAKHAWLTYWLRSGDTDVQLDVFAAVLDDDWLYEVDLYTHDGDQTQRSLWYTLLTQTLQYTPLTNALGE